MINRFVRFSFAISEIDRNLHKIMADEMAKLGLRGPHSVYLVRLNMHPEGLTAAELTRLCDRNKADVSRALADFEATGIIAPREGQNPYRATIRLTKEGKAIAEKLSSRVKLAVECIGNGLSEEKRESFYEALEIISSNMEKVTKNGLPSN